jgi:hypothetical protein
MKPNLAASAIDSPAELMRRVKLWASKINEDRRKHGEAIFMPEGKAACRAYDTSGENE